MNKTKEKSLKDMAEEERRNLISFFDLLLKIDKRNNPNKYGIIK